MEELSGRRHVVDGNMDRIEEREIEWKDIITSEWIVRL